MNIYSVRLKDNLKNKILNEIFYYDYEEAKRIYNNSLEYYTNDYPVILGYYNENVNNINELERLKENFDIHYFELYNECERAFNI